MFLKIESALQMQGVVTSVVIIIVSRTVWPGQKRDLGPRGAENLQRLHKADLDQAPQGFCTEGTPSHQPQDSPDCGTQEPTRPPPRPLGVQFSGGPDRQLLARHQNPQVLCVKYRNYINKINYFLIYLSYINYTLLP